jgi:hypothetical protein
MDLGDIPLVSVQHFFGSVLADIDNATINKIQSTLVTKQIIVGDRWKYFPKDPIVCKEDEGEIFAALQKVFDEIVKAIPLTLSEASVKFICSPNRTPISERVNTSRPDSHLELTTPKSVGEPVSTRHKAPPSRWEDIILPFEFKKANAPGDIKDVCKNFPLHVFGAR